MDAFRVVVARPRSSAASVVTVLRRRSRTRLERRAGRSRDVAPRARRGRRIAQEALGQPHAADVEADAEASAPTTSSVEPPPMSTTTVAGPTASAVTPRNINCASSSPRQQPRREAVAPLHLAEERLAVLGVADGTRRDRERPLGAEPLQPRAGTRSARCGRGRSARGRRRRRASTPSPSRVIRCAGRPPRRIRPSTSATSRRVVFVPRSTARRASLPGRDGAPSRRERAPARAPKRTRARATASVSRRRLGRGRTSRLGTPPAARATVARPGSPRRLQHSLERGTASASRSGGRERGPDPAGSPTTKTPSAIQT